MPTFSWCGTHFYPLWLHLHTVNCKRGPALWSIGDENFLCVTSDMSEGYRDGFSETNKKKLHSASGNCKTNILSIINLSLAHVALKANHGLIRFKRFVSWFSTKLCN